MVKKELKGKLGLVEAYIRAGIVKQKQDYLSKAHDVILDLLADHGIFVLADKPVPAIYKREETQKSIGDWADETFGPASCAIATAHRANSEMIELIEKAELRCTPDEWAEEAADVAIVLYRGCESMGVSLDAAIDRKMNINRHRQWNLDGKGHGQHIAKAEGK